jgi:ABC-type transport system substrate-binding protein
MSAQIASSVFVRLVRSSFGRQRLFLLLVPTLGLALGACTSPPPPKAAEPVTLNIGVALPKTPEASAGFRAFVNNLLSESLVGMGWDGRPFGRIASDWTWSDDGLTLELRIRPNMKFHDGKLADNTFIRDTLTRIFSNPPNRSFSVSYPSVTKVETAPDGVVRISLSRPEALLLADLSNSTISDPANDDNGLGPYRLLSRTPRVQLAAFDGYYRGRPNIDSVNVSEFEEQRSSWAALMRGQIDAVHEISPAARDFIDAEGQTGVRTFSFTRPYYIQLLFNVNHPVLRNPLVRQALSYAVDRQAIIDLALNKQGSVAEGPIWPFLWAYSTAQKTYTHNVEAATLRLDSAGLRMRKATETGRMPSRLRFKCLTVAKNSTFEKIAMVLQKQLYEIGVDMEIEPVSVEELGKRLGTGNYDAILAERTSGRSLAWTYLTFHSSKGLGYKATDKVLDRLRLVSTDGEIRTAVSDLQQIFHDDPPAIFIAWPKVARVVSSKFEVPDEGGRDVIGTLWQWKLSQPSQ